MSSISLPSDIFQPRQKNKRGQHMDQKSRHTREIQSQHKYCISLFYTTVFSKYPYFGERERETKSP